MHGSQGRDLDHVDHILDTLKKGSWVNTFLVVQLVDNLKRDNPLNKEYAGKIREKLRGELLAARRKPEL